jgi:Outer membrane lipoprotein carrier protein LolA-like
MRRNLPAAYRTGRRPLRVLIIPLLAAMLALASASRADVATVCPTLALGVTLYGRFVQERHLKGLGAPLKTIGDFVVAPSLGIIWRSTDPVASVTVITPEGIRRLADGKEVQRIASARFPAFAKLYDALDRAMIGDWSALAKDFTIDCTGDRKAWRVILKPIRAEGPMPARLAWILIAGGERIDKVEIMRANGDSENVEFFNQVVASTPPAAADAGLLNYKWE